MTEQTYLCFDFGLARTGVAVGNSVIREGKPLTIIHAKTNEKRWNAVNKLVAEWQPTAFVVGVPRHGDGTDSPMTLNCERFARQLNGRFHRKVHLVDERFSSVMVDDGMNKIDDEAAAIILQQFFDENPDA